MLVRCMDGPLLVCLPHIYHETIINAFFCLSTFVAHHLHFGGIPLASISLFIFIFVCANEYIDAIDAARNIFPQTVRGAVGFETVTGTFLRVWYAQRAAAATDLVPF